MTKSSDPPALQEGASPYQGAVCYVGSDSGAATQLSPEVGRLGRSVVTCTMDDVVRAVAEKQPPGALVVDADGVAPEALESMLKSRPSAVPLLVVGGAIHDVTPRLLAVRNGVDAYFQKPLPVQQVVEKLEVLTAERSPQPYRVLVVDDDELLTRLYVRTLEHAGMIAAAATDPLRVLARMDEFQPDIVLMDLQMPGVNGAELAAVIRLDPSRFSIPIVFLSSEDLRDRRLSALRRGGDDFLVKPIPLDQLVGEVAVRAGRARTVNSFMLRDGLTGLYNHATLLSLLDVELARAARHNKPLAFAMIDVDHFKKVNDTHGHPAGDRVLRALSQHLTKRLRRTDVIGRYGGEEFAAVLSDVALENVGRVMDQIRSSFAGTTHVADGVEFQVTLSAGVATFPATGESLRLVEAADSALYEAKRGGRNRVVVAG